MTRSPFLTLRALGLGVVALLLMAAMVALGLWQLGVYDDQRHDDAQSKLARPPVPLDDVIGPDDAFPADGVSRPVTVSGHYLPDEQFEVRRGQTLGVPSAVVTPLDTGNGSIMLVVRGRGDVGEAPPAGNVDLTGVLEPADEVGSSLDAGRTTDGIRTAALVQDFDQDLYAGYVVLTRSDPRDGLAAIPAPTPESSRWTGLRNLLYAFQWWLFAGFVAFMWWRIVTEGPDGVPEDHDSGDTADSSSTTVG
jgi:cytochrome oxidase assembly protein ShyY1